MPTIRLNKTHPNLFRASLAIALTHLGVGSLILWAFLNNPNPRNPVLAWIFISGFFSVALTTLYGLLAGRYAWVQRGMIAGLFFITFLSGVFILSVTYNYTSEEVRRLAWLIPPWPLWAVLHLLALQEPPSNPSSEVKE